MDPPRLPWCPKLMHNGTMRLTRMISTICKDQNQKMAEQLRRILKQTPDIIGSTTPDRHLKELLSIIRTYAHTNVQCQEENTIQTLNQVSIQREERSRFQHMWTQKIQNIEFECPTTALTPRPPPKANLALLENLKNAFESLRQAASETCTDTRLQSMIIAKHQAILWSLILHITTLLERDMIHPWMSFKKTFKAFAKDRR